MGGYGFMQKAPPRVIRADVKVGASYSSLFDTSQIRFEKYISYRNGLDYAVTVTDKAGAAVKIPPLNFIEKAAGFNDFVIDVRYRIKSPANIDMDDVVKYLKENNKDEYAAIASQCDSVSYFVDQGIEFVLSYIVTSHQMNSSMYNVYLEQMDVIVYSSDLEHKPIHPYSETGIKLREDIGNVNSFVYKIVINDPHCEFGDKFINIGGRVFRVAAIVDNLKASGVYVYNTREIGKEKYNDPYEETRYDFADVKSYIPLYNNVEEARNLGDIASARKREMEDLTHTHNLDMQKLKSEMADKEHARKIETMKHEDVVNELKRQLDILDHQLKLKQMYSKETMQEIDFMQQESKYDYERERYRRESRSTRDKYEREERSSFRKELLDILKWLPPLVIGIGAFMAKFKVVPAT